MKFSPGDSIDLILASRKDKLNEYDSSKLVSCFAPPSRRDTRDHLYLKVVPIVSKPEFFLRR